MIMFMEGLLMFLETGYPLWWINTPPKTIKGIAFTGTGGKLATGLIGGVFVNEIIAQATFNWHIVSGCQKLLLKLAEKILNLLFWRKTLKTDTPDWLISKWIAYGAAGTGSFLDQTGKKDRCSYRKRILVWWHLNLLILQG